MRPCKIEIDLSALYHNLDIAKQYAPYAQVVAMVKANAYGHGLIRIGHALNGKVAYLGVACIEEAIQLRENGIDSPILLVEGFFSNAELKQICHYDFATVIHTSWQLEAILEQPLAKMLDIWIKHDSGMHRLGFDQHQTKNAIQKLKKCEWIAHEIKLMTHFACADDVGNSHTSQQLTRFESLSKNYQTLPVSIANSAAVMSLPQKNLGNFIRPGLMLYGSSPIIGKTAASLDLRPVMTMKSEIIALRNCLAGESVGYAALWHARQDTAIATVAVGYGDGYPCHLANKGYVLIDNKKCPVVGRVSMDMLAVDVSQVTQPYIGQKVVLWGSGLPVDEVALFANTISYDLLCRAGLHKQRNG